MYAVLETQCSILLAYWHHAKATQPWTVRTRGSYVRCLKTSMSRFQDLSSPWRFTGSRWCPGTSWFTNYCYTPSVLAYPFYPLPCSFTYWPPIHNNRARSTRMQQPTRARPFEHAVYAVYAMLTLTSMPIYSAVTKLAINCYINLPNNNYLTDPKNSVYIVFT